MSHSSEYSAGSHSDQLTLHGDEVSWQSDKFSYCTAHKSVSAPLIRFQHDYYVEFFNMMWNHRPLYFFFERIASEHPDAAFGDKFAIYLHEHNVSKVFTSTDPGHIVEIIIFWNLCQRSLSCKVPPFYPRCHHHGTFLLNRRHFLTHLEEHHYEKFDLWSFYNRYSYEHPFIKQLLVRTQPSIICNSSQEVRSDSYGRHTLPLFRPIFPEYLANHRFLIPKIWDEIMHSTNLGETIARIAEEELGLKGCTYCMMQRDLERAPHIADLVVLCRLIGSESDHVSFHVIKSTDNPHHVIECAGYELSVPHGHNTGFETVKSTHDLGRFLSKHHHPDGYLVWKRFHECAAKRIDWQGQSATQMSETGMSNSIV